MFWRKAQFIWVLMCIYSSVVLADDACTIIAKQGLYDTHITKSSTQTFSQFKSSFCTWYSSYRESHSGGTAGVTIPIADIPVGFNGSMTFGEADAMASGLCSSAAGSNSDQVVWSDVTHYINPTAAQAFSDCIKATHGGLSVNPDVNDDETLFTLSIAYHAPDGANPTTITQVAIKGWNCPKPDNNGVDLRDFVNKAGQFGNSQVGLVCQREVKAAPYNYGGVQVVADPAVISIQTGAGNYTQFFRAKVYQDPLADGAKVLASYPKGTILPFVGHIEAIPAGWHLCDGHDGTVNLVDYIPYGASTNAQIDLATQDKHEGNRQHTHSVPDTAPPYKGFNSHVVQNGGAPMTGMGTDTQHHIGNTGPADNLPSVTRVFFIEKIN